MIGEEVRRALAGDRVVDITTRGRQTGQPRRIEIWFWRVGDRLYLTASPGFPRRWYSNLLAEPTFTLHLKQTAHADLPARAAPVLDAGERRRVLRAILAQIDGDAPDAWFPSLSPGDRAQIRAHLAEVAADREGQLERWVAESPLVEILL